MSDIQKKLLITVIVLLMLSMAVIIFIPLYQEFRLQQYPDVMLNNNSKDIEKDFLGKHNSIDDDPTHTSDEKNEILSVGMAALTSSRESLYYYNDLLEQLENSLNINVEIQQARTHSEMNDQILQGQVDIAFVCSYAYINLQDGHDIPLLAAPQINGNTSHHSLILAREDLNINSFQNLQDYSFAYIDPLSNAGKLYPLYMIKRQGSNSEEFFEHNSFTYSHNNAIESVSEGVVDAAAVDSLIYDQVSTHNPELLEGIELIHTSPAFTVPPLIASPKLESELRKDIKEFFLDLHNQSNGEFILRQLGIDQFVEIDDEDYDNIREMAEVVNSD